MRKFAFCFALSSLFGCFMPCARGQESRPPLFKSYGMVTGFGFGENTRTPYRPLFLLADHAFRIFRPAKKERKTFLTGYVVPQANLVFTQDQLEYEAGTNIGLRNHVQLSPNLYLYQMIGSGPHYFSARVARQAKGFLFSDNLAVGMYARVNGSNPFFLNLRFQFRHMSNASLKRPNGGINTFNLLVGVVKIYKRAS